MTTKKTVGTGDDNYKVYSTARSTSHDIYLSDTVDADGFNYIDLLRVFDNAEPLDHINFHLANFGGAVHAGLRIAHAMKNSEAFVQVITDAPCYSMGAILACSGNMLSLREGTFLMFHNYSGQESGKGNEMKDSLLNFQKHFIHSLEYLCYPFLTKREIKAVANDQDVYVHQSDAGLLTRMNRHFKGTS